MILSDEQRALRETARRFAEKKLLPDYQKREKSERLDRDLVREMGELGLIAPDMPEQFGGRSDSCITVPGRGVVPIHNAQSVRQAGMVSVVVKVVQPQPRQT